MSIRKSEVAEYFAPGSSPMLRRAWFPPTFLGGCNVNFVIARYGETFDLSGYLEGNVVDFQFGLFQAKRPIYSYASYLWDRIAKGTILVQGSFAVPFTIKQKIWAALQAQDNGVDAYKDKTTEKDGEALDAWDKMPLEDKIRVIKGGDLDGTIMEQALQRGIGPTSFENEKDWPTDTDPFGVGPKGMEIAIYYGNAPQPTVNAFQAIQSLKSKVDADPQSKVLTLHQVHIHQSMEAIRPKGAPVLDQYTFIARNFS